MGDTQDQNDKAKQSEAAQATDAKLSQPIFTNEEEERQRRKAAEDEQNKTLTPAPAGGVEGSNFSGGIDGREAPGLTGREDYRGKHPANAQMKATNKASDNRNAAQTVLQPQEEQPTEENTASDESESEDK